MFESPDNMMPGQLDRLDDYLSQSESKVAYLREGCEKKIVWHNNQRRRRDLAIVYLHGFSASRMETWPLCDRLADAMGANLFYTRLTGHGRDGAAMGRATVDSWLADAEEALEIGRRIGKQIILMGTSTGGTLATWLAAQPAAAPAIARLVLVSPNYMPKNPLAAVTLWPPGLRLLEDLLGGWRCFTAINKEHARCWTVRYPIRAIATMMRLVHLSWRIDLNPAAMPVLMMLNPWDRVINVSLAVWRYRSFPSSGKKLVFFRGNKDPGRHVLAGDILSPATTDKALGLIDQFLNRADP